MNSDQILAELDAQYQELIESVQLEGLSQDDNSEQSGQKLEAFRKGNLQNVGEIIKKYEQTLQTSREFYENEIKSLEEKNKINEQKYIESKKQIKIFETKINKITSNHQSTINAINEQKEKELQKQIKKYDEMMEAHNKLTKDYTKLTQQYSTCNDTINNHKIEYEEMKSKYESTFNELEELKEKYKAQKEKLTTKKMEVERYKVEIVQTREILDEEQKELIDTQNELKECREEINFLCTTNEELQEMNDTLNQQVEINTIIFDTKSDVTVVRNVNTVNNDNNDKNDINKKDLSIQPNVESLKSDCPKLRSTSSMLLIVEDNKIKDEMNRLESDRNTWHHQYESVCKEKNSLLEKIKKYENVIDTLQNELLLMKQQQEEEEEEKDQDGRSPTIKPSIELFTIQQCKECDEMRQQNQELIEQNISFEKRLKEFISLNDANQNKIDLITKQLEICKQDSSILQLKNDKIKEFEAVINTLKDENSEIIHLKNQIKNYEENQVSSLNEMKEYRSTNSELENKILILTNVGKELTDAEANYALINTKYNSLSNEYNLFRQQYDRIINKYKESQQNQEMYKSQCHQISINLKFINDELSQTKTEKNGLRNQNNQQITEIHELNSDLKSMFRDLENTKNELQNSTINISQLKQHLFKQSKLLQQTKQQWMQLKLQIDMNNMNKFNNNDISTVNDMNSNMNTIRNMNQINHIPSSSPSNMIQQRPKPTNTSLSQQSMSTGHKYRNKMNDSSTINSLLTGGNMMNIARGKPFVRNDVNHVNQFNSSNNTSSKQELQKILKERSSLEAALFKLPTKPRSLEQRKKKQMLERSLQMIENQIVSLK